MSELGPLSSRLAAHVCAQRYEHLPASTVSAAKRAILDGIGVMLAASGSSVEVEPFIELGRASAAEKRATLLGVGEKTTVLMAALCNGAMAHALDYEDAFDPAPLHPNASLLPAALSLCEQLPQTSGRDLIVAVAVGCDLACRLGLAVGQPLEVLGWYPPPIIGAYGATSACGRLLHLDALRLIDAYSLLSCQNVCPGEIKHSARTHLRAVREAFPAQAAVLSCLLAQNGTPGFEQPIEGPNGFYGVFAAGRYDPEVLMAGLGEHFYIEQLSFKKWPCCRGTHAFIEAALQLRNSPRLSAQDIVAGTLVGEPIHRMLAQPFERKCRPQTPIDAKFSLPFSVAAALCHGDPTLDTFAPSRLPDPEIQQLAARLTFVERPTPQAGHAASGTLKLTLKAGGDLECHIERAKGDPQHPVSDDELLEKFLDCCARARRPLEAQRARQLAERIMQLDEESSVAALIALC